VSVGGSEEKELILVLRQIGKRFYDFFIQLVLIVAGVLSALGVDNYRESIQEHKTEKEYLINLRNSVQSDTAAIKQEIQKSYDKINAVTQLLEMAASSRVIGEEAFGDLYTNVIMLVQLNYITAVYDELKFTGNFKLIRNTELKLQIISYYSDLAVILAQSNLGYPTHFMDQLTLDEIEFRTPFNQARILHAIRTDSTLRNELLRTQKRTSMLRSGMIYTSLPKSIALLDKLEIEIEK